MQVPLLKKQTRSVYDACRSVSFIEAGGAGSELAGILGERYTIVCAPPRGYLGTLLINKEGGPVELRGGIDLPIRPHIRHLPEYINVQRSHRRAYANTFAPKMRTTWRFHFCPLEMASVF